MGLCTSLFFFLFLVEPKHSPVVFQSLKLWLVEEQEGLTPFEFSLNLKNLLSRKTLPNQSSNGAILQRNFPILRSWKLCLPPCWILAGNHAMHYGLSATFTVHEVHIALWESTLLTVFELVVDNIPLVVWCENWLRWAWWQLELDLEGPSSGIWLEYGIDVEWFSRTEKNFSLKERKDHFLSLTQYSLGVELKFVECVNFCCWAWLKYAVTLKENPLNVN